MTVNWRIYGFPTMATFSLSTNRRTSSRATDLKKEFQAKYNYPLRAEDVEAIDEIGSFLTEKLKKDGTYGASFFANRPTRCTCSRNASASRAASSSIDIEGDGEQPDAVKSHRDAQRKPPHAAGLEKVRLRETGTFLKGESAMTISVAALWPFRRGFSRSEKALEWCRSRPWPEKWVMRCRRVVIRNWLRIAAVGRLQQQEQEAAYSLHPVAEQRGDQHQARQLPYTLRDPFRDSHFTDPVY